MTKETFIKIFNAIEKQMLYDIQQAKILTNVFKNAFEANLLYDTSIIINPLIELLSEAINDDIELIEWFIYETNFGKENCEITDDGEEIYINSAGELYDYVIKK